MRPCRVTLLPIVTALFALTASRAEAHPGSSIVVDQKGRVFFIDSGGEGFLWDRSSRQAFPRTVQKLDVIEIIGREGALPSA